MLVPNAAPTIVRMTLDQERQHGLITQPQPVRAGSIMGMAVKEPVDAQPERRRPHSIPGVLRDNIGDSAVAARGGLYVRLKVRLQRAASILRGPRIPAA